LELSYSGVLKINLREILEVLLKVYTRIWYATSRCISAAPEIVWPTNKEQVSFSIPFIGGDIKQWYSTGGTRRHLRGYVKFKISIYILFHE
jgi:hypothetical protein